MGGGISRYSKQKKIFMSVLFEHSNLSLKACHHVALGALLITKYENNRSKIFPFFRVESIYLECIYL